VLPFSGRELGTKWPRVRQGVHPGREAASWACSPCTSTVTIMSGRPRTTSFADAAKASQASFGSGIKPGSAFNFAMLT